MSPARLPLRVRPADHEPAYGVLNRLALRHGAISTMEVLQSIPFLGSTPRMLLASARVGRLTGEVAAMAGLPAALLAGTTFVHGAAEEGVSPDLFLIGKQFRVGPICTACIREDLDVRSGPELVRPHRRMWWDLSAVVCCPRHAVPLTMRCPACSRSLGQWQLSPRLCGCGFDFARHVEAPMPEVDVQAAAYLVSRLTGAGELRSPLLDAMPLAVAGSGMMWIGRTATFGAEPPPTAGMTVGEHAAAASIGFWALTDVPGVLVPILNSLVARRTEDGGLKIVSYYGALYRWLWHSKQPSLDPLKAILARHAASEFPRTGTGDVFGSESLPQDGITFGEAARTWNLHYLQACTIAGLVGIGVSSIRRNQVITAAECASVTAWLAARVGQDEAREMLGVTIKVFYNLRDAGLIRREGDPAVIHRAYYEREAIEQLVAGACRDAPTVTGCPPDCSTLVGASQPFFGTVEMVRALLDGSLRPAGVLASERGLAAVVVKSADIPRISTGADDGMITGVEAARMLCMSTTETITQAIRHGLLSATYPGGTASKAGRLLKLSDVIEFDHRYAVAASLRKAFPALSNRSISSMLPALGVVQVFTGNARGTVYVRADAERALARRMGRVEVRVRRHYTAEFKAAAVARLETSGEGVTRVAADLGLAIGALLSWRRKGRSGPAAPKAAVRPTPDHI